MENNHNKTSEKLPVELIVDGKERAVCQLRKSAAVFNNDKFVGLLVSLLPPKLVEV